MTQIKNPSRISQAFNNFSTVIIKYTGNPVTFVAVVMIIVIWAATGPLFHYSDTWQLVVNTATSVITFLMVFILQQTQNKDTAAIHLKLNELIACNMLASNRLISIEDLTPEELETLKTFYVRLADLAKKDVDLYASHSLDEANSSHAGKLEEMENNPVRMKRIKKKAAL